MLIFLKIANDDISFKAIPCSGCKKMFLRFFSILFMFYSLISSSCPGNIIRKELESFFSFFNIYKTYIGSFFTLHCESNEINLCHV